MTGTPSAVRARDPDAHVYVVRPGEPTTTGGRLQRTRTPGAGRDRRLDSPHKQMSAAGGSRDRIRSSDRSAPRERFGDEALASEAGDLTIAFVAK